MNRWPNRAPETFPDGTEDDRRREKRIVASGGIGILSVAFGLAALAVGLALLLNLIIAPSAHGREPTTPPPETVRHTPLPIASSVTTPPGATSGGNDDVAPPSRLSLQVDANDPDNLTVNYTQSVNHTQRVVPLRYRFELYRWANDFGRYLLADSVDDVNPPANFNNVPRGYWYVARGQSCAIYSRVICGPWSAWSNAQWVPNNREPSFEASGYSFSVAGNASAGTLVGTVSATDLDSGDTVSYSIASGNTSGDFRIGSQNGQIIATGSLDHSSYTLKVRASDGNGGTATATVDISVAGDAEPALPPAPVGLQSEAETTDSISIKWTGLTGTAKYRLEYSRSAQGQWALADSNMHATSTAVPGLACGARYDFRVSAYGNGSDYRADWGEFSHLKGVSSLLCGAPAPVLSAATTNAAITVSWAPTSGVTKRQVRHRRSGASSWVESPDLTGSSYPLSGVVSGFSYETQARAYGDGVVYAAGWGTWSDSFVAAATAPLAPPGLTADETRASTILLTSEAVAGAAEYQIRYRGQEDAEWTEGTKTDAPRYVASGLSPASTYWLQVRAKGDGAGRSSGWGPWSPSLRSQSGPARGCAEGTAVASPDSNPALVDDCSILLGLKDALAGAARLNWSSTLSMATWDGVTVSGSPRRVTGLTLSDKGLNGTIPGSLGSVTRLATLDLSDNALTGGIPAELGDLAGLMRLVLKNNELTGTIPAELGELASLTEVGLAGNELFGCAPLSWRRGYRDRIDDAPLPNCRLAMFVAAQNRFPGAGETTTLVAVTFPENVGGISYNWQELVSGEWTDLGRHSKFLTTTALVSGIRAFRVQVFLDGKPDEPPLVSGLRVIWNWPAIFDEFMSEVFAGGRNSAAYRAAEANLLTCMKQRTGEAFQSIEHTLTRYTGSFKDQINACYEQHDVFEGVNGAYRSEIGRVAKTSTSFNMLLSLFPSLSHHLGRPYFLRTKGHAEDAAMPAQEQSVNATAGDAQRGLLGCLHDAHGNEIDSPTAQQKFDALNCLIIDTPFIYWLQQADEFKELIDKVEDGNRPFGWLGTGDWTCSFPELTTLFSSFQMPVELCLRHDVAYASLQKLYGDMANEAPIPNSGLDSAWNARNKNLADFIVASEPLPHIIPCDNVLIPEVAHECNAYQTNRVFLQSLLELGPRRATLWPATRYDVQHSMMRYNEQGQFDASGNLKFVPCPPSGAVALGRSGQTDSTLRFRFDQGCVPEQLGVEVKPSRYEVCEITDGSHYLNFLRFAQSNGLLPDAYGRPTQADCTDKLPSELNGQYRVDSFEGLLQVTLKAIVDGDIKVFGTDAYPEIVLYDRNDS